MKLSKIVSMLDREFNTMEYIDLWGRYDSLINPIKEYLTCKFISNYSGLMIHNGDDVDKIITTTFITEDLYNKVLSEDIKNTLIFTHHPFCQNLIDYSWEDVTKHHIKGLKLREISIYSCHIPFDEHKRYSTSYYMADELMDTITDEIYARDKYTKTDCFVGFYGKASKNLFNRIRKINSDSRYYKLGDSKLDIIACVPGGGLQKDFLIAAKNIGVDTYITGCSEYRGGNSVVRNYKLFNELQELELNVIGIGHYHSEAIGIKKFTEEYLSTLGIDVEYFEDTYYLNI